MNIPTPRPVSTIRPRADQIPTPAADAPDVVISAPTQPTSARPARVRKPAVSFVPHEGGGLARKATTTDKWFQPSTMYTEFVTVAACFAISGLACHHMRYSDGGGVFAKAFTRRPKPSRRSIFIDDINAPENALHYQGTGGSTTTDPEVENIMRTFAQEFGLHAAEYHAMSSYAQDVLNKPRASASSPSREANYGHNTDVHDTILSAIYDQLMFGSTADGIDLHVEYPDDVAADERHAEELHRLTQEELHRATVYHDAALPEPTLTKGETTKGRDATIPNKAEPKDGADRTLKTDIKAYELLDMRDCPEEDKPRMLAAIAKEINDLVATGCFAVVEIPYDRTAINSRIVLKVKYRANGEYDKHKARLVAKGFMERLGADFFSTFSPMASLTTARALLALAVHKNLPVHHSDIPQAFIKSLLDTDIWLKLPPGINLVDENGKAHKIVKLIRSLYGLRQSPQLFNKELVRFMHAENFKQTNADTCLFTKRSDAGWICVASEVDDLLVTGTDTAGIEEFRKSLQREYEIKDWEPISSFLGINIVYNQGMGELQMDVETKIDNLLDRHQTLKGHLKGKADIAMIEDHMKVPDDHKLTTAVDSYLHENYASINGALIYMGITCRPDMAFALSKTSKGMHNPRPKHIAMLRHLLLYVYQNKQLALSYSRDDPPLFRLLKDASRTDAALSFLATSDAQHIQRFTGFADANFSNLYDDERKSNTGLCIFMFGSAICWKAKLQPLTATSTHEAELIACATAALEVIWCRKLILDLGFAFDLPIVNLRDNETIRQRCLDDGISITDEEYELDPLMIFNDNLGTTQTINNPDATSQRVKHIDNRYLRIRQYVKARAIRVSYIGTDLNIADFFTKGLTRVKFHKFRMYIGMREKT